MLTRESRTTLETVEPLPPQPCIQIPHRLRDKWVGLGFAALALLFLGFGRTASGQADQGTITGIVQYPSGAGISDASVTLANQDTGQVLKTRTNGYGVYFFSPIKIGN